MPQYSLSILASVERAAALIEEADALVVAAGAGMGVDSELPDFLGREGFWEAYPALGRAKVDFHGWRRGVLNVVDMQQGRIVDLTGKAAGRRSGGGTNSASTRKMWSTRFTFRTQ